MYELIGAPVLEYSQPRSTCPLYGLEDTSVGFPFGCGLTHQVNKGGGLLQPQSMTTVNQVSDVCILTVVRSAT